MSRLAPLSGLVVVALIVVVIFFLPSSPSSDASAAKAVSFFTAHRHSQMAIAFLVWYAMFFAVIFGAALRSYLRNRGGSDTLVNLGFIGMGFLALAFSIAVALLYAAADVPAKISPSSEQALNVLQNDLFPPVFVGIALFMFGTGLAIVRATVKALPTWLGWFALLTGLVAVVPPFSWFSLFGLLVWMLIVSILIYLREGRPTPAPVTTG
ncbi:MAG: hypothetical protein ACXVRZ_19105 [Gaiellaceae bacterium]